MVISRVFKRGRYYNRLTNGHISYIDTCDAAGQGSWGRPETLINTGIITPVAIVACPSPPAKDNARKLSHIPPRVTGCFGRVMVAFTRSRYALASGEGLCVVKRDERPRLIRASVSFAGLMVTNPAFSVRPKPHYFKLSQYRMAFSSRPRPKTILTGIRSTG